MYRHGKAGRLCEPVRRVKKRGFSANVKTGTMKEKHKRACENRLCPGDASGRAGRDLSVAILHVGSRRGAGAHPAGKGRRDAVSKNRRG